MISKEIKVQFKFVFKEFNQTFQPDKTIEQVCKTAASQNKIELKNVNFYYKGQIIMLENNNKPISQFISPDKFDNPKISIEIKPKNANNINNFINDKNKGYNNINAKNNISKNNSEQESINKDNNLEVVFIFNANSVTYIYFLKTKISFILSDFSVKNNFNNDDSLKFFYDDKIIGIDIDTHKTLEEIAITEDKNKGKIEIKVEEIQISSDHIN